MSTLEIPRQLEQLNELEGLIGKGEKEADTLREESKTEVLGRNTEEIGAGK